MRGCGCLGDNVITSSSSVHLHRCSAINSPRRHSALSLYWAPQVRLKRTRGLCCVMAWWAQHLHGCPAVAQKGEQGGCGGSLASNVHRWYTAHRCYVRGCVRERVSMRFLIVTVALVFALALASGAFAQTTEEPTKPSPPATSQSGLDEVAREHPGWFMEPNSYKPCPSSVLFSNRPACLGCPHGCRWYFPNKR